MKPVAVTGVSGFIGSRVLAHFRRVEIPAKGITRGVQGSIQPGIMRCDYLNLAGMTAALSGCRAVVHIAGLAHADTGRGAAAAGAFQAANVDAAVNVARAAIAAGVQRMVLLSSASVMGVTSPPAGFADDDVPAPHDKYARSKLLAELRVQELSGPDFEVIRLRPPMVYGLGAPGSFDRIVKWISRGWPLPLAAATARRSVISIRNLCEVLEVAADTSRRATGAMLVADADPLSVSQFLREVGAAMDRRVRLVAVPPAVLQLAAGLLGRKADLKRLNGLFEISGMRASQELGWLPRYSTRDELRVALRAESH